MIIARDVAELRSLRAARAVDGSGAAPGGLAPQGFTLPYHDAGGGDGTIQLEPVSTGSFTVGTRGTGGYRYVYATYRVRNAQADGTHCDTSRENLTFYAVDTDWTIGRTAISSLKRFDGGAADPDLAAQLIPTGAVVRNPQSLEVEPAGPDVLQVLTETEAEEILSLAGEGVVDVFPYGFVVRRLESETTRELPANPDEDQYDGVVTFAFKVPLQESPADDPFTIRMVFLAVDDDEVKLTQSVEEQTGPGWGAFDLRADSLEANVLTLLPPAGGTVWLEHRDVRLFCEVRVAGPAGTPTATLGPEGGTEAWLAIPPLDPPAHRLARTVRLAAARCPDIPSADPTSFVVHGFQSGRNLVGAYSGVGSSLVFAPMGPGGDFFPGEEVEVTLTTGLGGTRPVVGRYRIASTSGSGSFGSQSNHTVGARPESVVLGDLDGNGDLDMAVASVLSANVSVFSNDGGNFSLAATYPVGDGPESIALGDVDGDGDLDVVAANFTTSRISVLLNDGRGSFAFDAGYTMPAEALSVALGDVDGDGSLDLAATSNDGTVRMWLNQ